MDNEVTAIHLTISAELENITGMKYAKEALTDALDEILKINQFYKEKSMKTCHGVDILET